MNKEYKKKQENLESKGFSFTKPNGFMIHVFGPDNEKLGLYGQKEEAIDNAQSYLDMKRKRK